VQIHPVDDPTYGKSISITVADCVSLTGTALAAISEGKTMNDPLPATKVTGLDERDRQAVETLYRAFSEGNPDLLDQAVTPDWRNWGRSPGKDEPPSNLYH